MATTHSEGNLAKLAGAGATAVLADMGDAERLQEISRGVDAVSLLVPFLLADPADGLRYAKNVIDAAVANGVKLLVWNTTGFILPQKVGNPPLDLRIDIQEYLKASGLPHITIQPSVYAENMLGPWTAPFVRTEKKVAYPTPEKMPVGWIATQDVAALVAEAIYRPELAGSSFQVSGLENLDGSQLARKFTMGLGEPIAYYSMPPKDFGAILDGLYGPGAGKGAEDVYQQIADSSEYPVMFSDQMEEVLTKLPVKMTPIEVWVAQHRAQFQN